MDVGGRIKSLRERNDFSQRDLGKKVNISSSVINRIELGTRPIRDNELLDIARVFGVSVDYLLGNDVETIPYEETIKLQILGSVRAGVGGVAFEELIGYEKAYCDNCTPQTHFYLKVKGDSMQPRILEGDLALVKRQSDVINGELAIVLVNGEEGVIKKVIKKDNSIELHSFNPYYPPRVFEGADMQKVKIIGKVIKTLVNW